MRAIRLFGVSLLAPVLVLAAGNALAAPPAVDILNMGHPHR